MRVDCHIPITIRLTGALGEAQLEELARTLTEVVRARTAEAERLVAARLGRRTPAGPAEARERYDPARDGDRGYAVASYQHGGRPQGVPVRGAAGPWTVLRAVDFRARVGRFLDFVERLHEGGRLPEQTLYGDRREELRRVVLWWVRTGRDHTLAELSDGLYAHAARLVRLGPGQVLATAVWVTDDNRAALLALDEDKVLGDRIGRIGPHNARRIEGRGATAVLRHGGWALYAAMVLPKVELTDLATLGRDTVLRLPAADAAFCLDVRDFESRYGLTTAQYLGEFGTLPVPVWLQPLTVRRRTRPAALALLLARRAEERIPSGDDRVTGDRLLVLTDPALSRLPASVRERAGAWTNPTTRRLDDRADTYHLEPGRRCLFARAVLPVDTERLGAARYRPRARPLAARLRGLLGGDPTERSWQRAMSAFLDHEFEEDPPSERPDGGTLFEYVLAELAGDFARLYDVVEASRHFRLRHRLLRLSLATSRAADPRVAKLRESLTGQRLAGTRNEYRTDPTRILLDREPGRAVAAGGVLGEVESIYTTRRDLKRLRPARVETLRKALEAERVELVGRIARGEDRTTYDQERFATAVLAGAVRRVGLTGADFVNVTVERSIRLLEVRRQEEGGLPDLHVQFEFVERVVGEKGWTRVGGPVLERAGSFEERLTWWRLGRAGEVYRAAGIVVAAVGAVLLAWEAGVVAALVSLGGGSGPVLGGIAISEVVYFFRVIFGDAKLTPGGILIAALDGYLLAVGFRFGGVPARWAAEAVGTGTLRQTVAGWAAQALVRGSVGGATSSALTTFAHDVVHVATGEGSWSGIRTYVANLALGAVIGIVAEFVLAPALREALVGARGAVTTAAGTAARLRAAGWGAREWVQVSTEALANLRATLGTFMGDVAARGFAEAMAGRLAEVATELGGRELARHVLELAGARFTLRASAGLARLLPALEAAAPARAHTVARILSEHPAETVHLLEALTSLDRAATRRLVAGTFASTEDLAAFLGRLSEYTPAEQRAVLRLLAQLDIVAGRPVPSGTPSDLVRRQFGASLRIQAAGAEMEARRLEQELAEVLEKARAAEARGNTRRAGALRDEAEVLRTKIEAEKARAVEARAEAGRATPRLPELPAPADIERALGQLESRGSAQTWIRLPAGLRFRDHPELLERVVRPVFRSRTGNRVVFRIEGGTPPAASRERVLIDAHGQARVLTSGTDPINLNFGLFERAVEFLIRARPGARLKVFEVEEGWFRALRSHAVPEQGKPASLLGRPPGTPPEGAVPLPPPPKLKEVTGRPRVVDTRYGQDQLQIPEELISELNEFIVPGSGRVVEFKP
ncbi:hypothetical protein [Streptomyces sp. NRRL S-350]|uniref:hypothetical protein n=1 Tax=Streptomyces sp. NRRL S-350 TaxID=1463902 RepID=UPI0004C02E9D|nr:hypothetical protein [Streptomyces sp. NRRL S-350]